MGVACGANALPLLHSAKSCHDGRSPGIATLKEAFDITYAVHQMEKEQDGVEYYKVYEYSRSGNFNRNALEHTITLLGGAYVCVGSAATATAIPPLGPNVHMTTSVDLKNADEAEIKDVIQENAKPIWIESPTNSTLHLIYIPRIVSIVHAHPSDPLVLVDKTPPLTILFLQGADIVMHSLTKHVNAHFDVVMGAWILPTHRMLSASSSRSSLIYGGLEEAQRFLKATRLFALAESLGGMESLVVLPVSMMHESIPPKELEHLGIGDNSIRLSVGIEGGMW
ncbi:hypothetical protein EW146_g9738 [Bondarzewia mesenterica]|uniref:cystathionine gamma-lyase n=1 Tax=Bondarzewia mesenterica TaxID=1095465 RepID=A0A4S4L403_9AGAM|nr:hypothetical protein EW146_g9738 [Bondarzewia mesenterica]